MKVFIAWSGARSHALAERLSQWLEDVNQQLKPFISSENIQPGQRWGPKLAAELQEATFGIICVTRDNVFSPWLHFETGALSIPYERERVCPILFDVDQRDKLPDTLSQFQLVTPNKAELLQLVTRFNAELGRGALDGERLKRSFETNWPDFDKSLKELISSPQQQDRVTPGHVGGALENLEKASRFDNPIFQYVVLRGVARFEDQCGEWAKGTLEVPASIYNRVLLDLYRLAKQSVFSTSATDYLDTWCAPLGREILAAHRKAGVPVRRVFVFNSRKDVTRDALRAMEEQAKAGIEVLVYFDDEDRNFQFDPRLSRDFTVVDDGRVIGVTQQYGVGNLRARWHFDDRDLWRDLRDVQESLRLGSKAYADVKDALEQALAT